VGLMHCQLGTVVKAKHQHMHFIVQVENFAGANIYDTWAKHKNLSVVYLNDFHLNFSSFLAADTEI